MADDLRNYRRMSPMTEITELVVVRRVEGLHRRVLWRMRELGVSGLGELLEQAGKPMRRDSLAHALDRPRIRRTTFDLLTEMLRMDEVDGWDRPFPELPPVEERLDLVDVTLERLTAEGPGEE